jgi:hypothetical protein
MVVRAGLHPAKLAERLGSPYVDVNSADGDDRTVDRVLLSRNPALVVGDKGDVASVEDAPRSGLPTPLAPWWAPSVIAYLTVLH